MSIQALAELTAKTVEQYHKAGELLLLQGDHDTDMLDRAKALARFDFLVLRCGNLHCYPPNRISFILFDVFYTVLYLLFCQKRGKKKFSFLKYTSN